MPTCNAMTGWWFQVFLIFTPILGEWSNLTVAYFSKGLVQPPTSWDIKEHGSMGSIEIDTFWVIQNYVTNLGVGSYWQYSPIKRSNLGFISFPSKQLSQMIGQIRHVKNPLAVEAFCFEMEASCKFHTCWTERFTAWFTTLSRMIVFFLDLVQNVWPQCLERKWLNFFTRLTWGSVH